MTNASDKLGLDFDPFAPDSTNRQFFTGAGRGELLSALVQQASHGGGLLSVSGAPGSGKTSLATALADAFGKDVICVQIQGSLFMGPEQFLEQIQAAVGLEVSAVEKSRAIDSLCQFANDLALEGRSLVLVVDDAHELASEVYKVLFTLLRRNSGGGFAALLLGEEQLKKLLLTNLPESQRKLHHDFSLPAFSGEDSFDYLRFKLSLAGYRKPLPLGGEELGRIHEAAGGIPAQLSAKFRAALERETTAGEGDDRKQGISSLWRLGQNYWALAGGLAGLLLLVLLVQPSDPEPVSEGSRQRQIAVSAAGQSPQETDSPQSSSADGPTSVVAVDAAPADADRQETAPAQQAPADVSSEAQATASAQAFSPVPELSDSAYGEFEQALLSYPPGNYAIQIMGASSARQIGEFLARYPQLPDAGYFESRFRGQPWFVVVAGNYSERASAQQAIDRLPAALRELQPWVRSIADIQSAIRSLPR
ncbi:MAG: AAA family ATPase [Pseudomonadales bacterium]|nr:AAA family ATPase [Pseudomonadales bacterium]